LLRGWSATLGASKITGNLGVNPSAAVVGFPPGIVTGTIHKDDSVALRAKNDLASAYGALASDSCTGNLTGQNLGGLTLTPGVYCYSSAASLSGRLTLNTGGNAGAVYVFQISGSLTTSGSASVVMTGGSGCNVFWQVGGAAVLGTKTEFAGSILSAGSITMGSGTNSTGAAMTKDGSMVMSNNQVASQCSNFIWKQQMEHIPPPVTGCYQIAYPNAAWGQMACRQAPDNVTFNMGAGFYGPEALTPSGTTIGTAIGEFSSMTGYSSEDSAGTCCNLANYYSIQLNTNKFYIYYDNEYTFAWFQFVWANDPGIGEGYAQMELWLLNWYSNNNNSCPSGSPGTDIGAWGNDGIDCTALTYSAITNEDDPSNLPNLTLEGSVLSPSGTSVEFCDSTYCDSIAVSDILGLHSAWTETDFDVYGFCCGYQADFYGTGSSGADWLSTVYLYNVSGSPFTPMATTLEPFTGETNNLNYYSLSSYFGSYDFYECNTTPC